MLSSNMTTCDKPRVNRLLSIYAMELKFVQRFEFYHFVHERKLTSRFRIWSTNADFGKFWASLPYSYQAGNKKVYRKLPEISLERHNII